MPAWAVLIETKSYVSRPAVAARTDLVRTLKAEWWIPGFSVVMLFTKHDVDKFLIGSMISVGKIASEPLQAEVYKSRIKSAIAETPTFKSTPRCIRLATMGRPCTPWKIMDEKPTNHVSGIGMLRPSSMLLADEGWPGEDSTGL